MYLKLETVVYNCNLVNETNPEALGMTADHPDLSHDFIENVLDLIQSQI